MQAAVHGGRHEDPGPPPFQAPQGRGQGRGDDAVGHAGGHLVERVVGGRSHQVGVEGIGVGQVLGLRGQAAHHRMRGAPLQGLRGDVARPFAGEEGHHVGPPLAQGPGQQRRLHGGDAAGHPEGDAAAFELIPLPRYVVVPKVRRRGG